MPGHPRCSDAEFTLVCVHLVVLVFAQKLSVFLIFLRPTQLISSHDASLIRLNVQPEC